MALRDKEPRCERCGGSHGKLGLGRGGRLLCPRCQWTLAEWPRRGTLHRLFRLRPARRGGRVIYERYEER